MEKLPTITAKLDPDQQTNSQPTLLALPLELRQAILVWAIYVQDPHAQIFDTIPALGDKDWEVVYRTYCAELLGIGRTKNMLVSKQVTFLQFVCRQIREEMLHVIKEYTAQIRDLLITYPRYPLPVGETLELYRDSQLGSSMFGSDEKWEEQKERFHSNIQYTGTLEAEERRMTRLLKRLGEERSHCTFFDTLSVKVIEGVLLRATSLDEGDASLDRVVKVLSPTVSSLLSTSSLTRAAIRYPLQQYVRFLNEMLENLPDLGPRGKEAETAYEDWARRKTEGFNLEVTLPLESNCRAAILDEYETRRSLLVKEVWRADAVSEKLHDYNMMPEQKWRND